MKRVALLILFTSIVASAQWSDTVTAVTSGDFDDVNPSVDHAGLSAAPLGGIYGFKYAEEWLVLERWTGESDAIAAVKFTGSTLKWDSSVTVISPAKAGVVRKYPDVCTDKKGISLAAWQEMSDSVWNIYYSFCNVDSGNWSAPVALTNDSVSNTNVEVRALSDTSFVLLWKRGSTVLFSVYKSGGFSTIDTLVHTDTDSTDYDFAGNRLVWTERSNSGNRYCLVSTVESFAYPALYSADTVMCAGDIGNPRFMVFGGGPAQTFTFDLFSDGKYTAWWSSYPMVTGYTPEELAGDTGSSYLHPVFYTPPYVVAVASNVDEPYQLFSFNFYAWEKRTATDTSVVFYDAGVDSIQAGSDPSVSFLTFPVSPQNYLTYLGFVVWQSDRSGTSHIYSRSFEWSNSGIGGPVLLPARFQLHQNYPNPFNPSTVISYDLPKSSVVILRVYDILGRAVETLVNARQSSGVHSITFDGSRLASGVYFYRLTASGVNIVRKMLLEK